MKEKIIACYERLQTLIMMTTLENTEKLLQTLYDLREIYNDLEKEDTNDRKTAGS